MTTCEVSAVLFVRNKSRVATFYREALGFSCTADDEHHSRLNCGGFELIVHQIPEHILAECNAESESKRRETAPTRLDFPVDSIETARTLAASLGGQVDAMPPDWAPRDANFYFGTDPEGNVFGLSQRAR